MPVNASGINPDGPLAVVQRKHAEGYRAFKLKIGFSDQQDLDHLVSLRAWLGPQADLMADVNEAWDLRRASAMLQRLDPLGLAWLEGPLRSDCSSQQWQQLRANAGIPLAARTTWAPASV